MGWVGVIDGLPALQHGPLLPETNMPGLVLLLLEEERRLCTVAEGTLQEDCCANRKTPRGNLPSQAMMKRWESVNLSASH